jgi:hypothetical protein
MAFYMTVSVPESAGAGWRAAASSARERTPRPAFPARLLQTAPGAWFRLAAGALSFAGVYAGRQAWTR